MGMPDPPRDIGAILDEMQATRRRASVWQPMSVDRGHVDAEDALRWLVSLGTSWRETSDEGRRQLAIATCARLGVASGPERGSHRIVSVEVTDEAERRGSASRSPPRSRSLWWAILDSNQ